MLPIPALPTAATMPSGGETPAAQPGAEAQGADFLALLASQSGDMTPAALPEAPLEAAGMPPVPATAPAIGLPETGKGLPPALPQVPVLSEAPPAEADMPQPARIAVPPALARTLMARQRPDQEATPAKERPHAEAAAEAPAETTPQPDPPQPLIAALLPAAPLIEAGRAELVPAASARSLPVIQQRLATAPSPAPVNQPVPEAPQLPTITIAPPQQPAQQPVTLTEIADAAPRITANLRVAATVQPAEKEPALATAPSDQLTPLAAPQTPAGPAAPSVLAQPAPLTRPHEFATLVDRLVAAREALQPQSVSLAVQHAQFGQVQVHFRQDDLGLSVSLTNADPDFARAVSAAVPPVLTASNTDSAALGTAARQDQPATGTADTTGQQRGQSSAQRDDRGARANPAPQTNRTQPQGASTQPDQGIYA